MEKIHYQIFLIVGASLIPLGIAFTFVDRILGIAFLALAVSTMCVGIRCWT